MALVPLSIKSSFVSTPNVLSPDNINSDGEINSVISDVSTLGSI